LAATVMLVRDAEVAERAGIEVFMLRRTLSAVFGSGMYVFPGGRVEDADGDDLDSAHRRAAIRECFEEAGVLLARAADGTTIVDGHAALAARLDVHDGTLELTELCARHGLTLGLDELAWVSHWITPMGERRRFDTRFYLVPAPRGQSSVHDDTETIASLWIDPAEALRRQAAGEMTMMPPTIKNLQFLAGHTTVADVMAAAVAHPSPSAILPRLRVTADGEITGVSIPGDDDYELLT
jgi:8-oxo-dGTP pyrophosphatase MutT (NUDIX family)